MTSSAQQILELRDAPIGASSCSCRGIFASNYLIRHFAEQSGYPTEVEVASLHEEAKELWQEPSHTLANSVRALAVELSDIAPTYLKPSAQQQLLATPASCLAVIELAVNWEAEKLYGVEGGGPFDEF